MPTGMAAWWVLLAGLGVIRDEPLDETPPRLELLSLPLMTSDSDALAEDAAFANLLIKPRVFDGRAGAARTCFVLVPSSADTPVADEEVNVSGVEEDAPSDGDDGIA